MAVVGCVFCDLLTDDGPATWVAREEGAAAFLPLPNSVLAPGRILVAPTEHAVGVQDASPQALVATMVLVQKISRAMRAALGAPGVNVLNASGPGSEQSVPHLHFHLVPRWEDDDFSTWPQERSVKVLTGDPGRALAEAVAALTP
jgi:histidine triad (HIT) family protein